MKKYLLFFASAMMTLAACNGDSITVEIHTCYKGLDYLSAWQ